MVDVRFLALCDWRVKTLCLYDGGVVAPVIDKAPIFMM